MGTACVVWILWAYVSQGMWEPSRSYLDFKECETRAGELNKQKTGFDNDKYRAYSCFPYTFDPRPAAERSK